MRSYWFECKEPRRHWNKGEYLITAFSASCRMWAIYDEVSRLASGPYTTKKQAVFSLKAEFNTVELIRTI